MGFKNEHHFKCLQCGICCKAGYKVLIHPKDIKKWIKSKKTGYSRYIQIDPECISIDKNSKMKLDETLEDFILNSHKYLGSDPRPLRIKTLLSNFEKTPIFIPKNYKTIWKGWKKGLIYVLRRDMDGDCPFRDGNLCGIHRFKPYDCSIFPYHKNGKMRTDMYTLAICKALKKIN